MLCVFVRVRFTFVPMFLHTFETSHHDKQCFTRFLFGQLFLGIGQ